MPQMVFDSPQAELDWARSVWLEAAAPAFIRASAAGAEPSREQQTLEVARMIKAAEVFIGTELFSDDGSERILDVAFREGLTVQQALHEIMIAFAWLANGHGGIPEATQTPNTDAEKMVAAIADEARRHAGLCEANKQCVEMYGRDFEADTGGPLIAFAIMHDWTAEQFRDDVARCAQKYKLSSVRSW